MPEPAYETESWSLSNLFPGLDSPELVAAYERLEADISSFERWRDRLGPALGTEEFCQILQETESATRQIYRLYGFASLSFAGNTQDQAAQIALAKVQQVAAEAQNRTLFFALWWKGLEDDLAARFLQASGDYRYWLESLRREKPYTLSEAEEKIINLKDVNGVTALNTLYQSITNRYTFQMVVDGQEKTLNREELQAYYRHPDPAMRAASYQALHAVYEKDAPILGQIYQYLVRNWRSENVGLRGFKTPIAVRNLNNDIPDEVVETLLAVCQANMPLFHRYFRLKARWLGMEKLRRYDIYAPVAESGKSYTYADAVNLVLNSFAHFDEEVASLARRLFEQHHVDSEIRTGKQSGAFCMTLGPDLTPWVLLSYKGKPNDVATLAHELGHAIHSLLADHHPLLTQHASLPLAETASTFGEMLVIDRLMAEDPDPAVRRDLLFQQMDDAYATILRQASFALFEREAHKQVQDGASVDEISALYFRMLQEQFGDAVALSQDFQFEWVEIPHIYSTPFYVYAYAFGQLLVLSLYRQYRQEGASFKPRYKAILAAGGSASPAAILEHAGIDMRSAAFWQGGFDVVAELLAELETIALPDA